MEKTSKLDNVINYFEKEYNLVSESYDRFESFSKDCILYALTTFALLFSLMNLWTEKIPTWLYILILGVILATYVFTVGSRTKSHIEDFDKKRKIKLILNRLYTLGINNIDENELEPLVLKINDCSNDLSSLFKDYKTQRKMAEDRLEEFFNEVHAIKLKK